jgi:hypothetical protein
MDDFDLRKIQSFIRQLLSKIASLNESVQTQPSAYLHLRKKLKQSETKNENTIASFRLANICAFMEDCLARLIETENYTRISMLIDLASCAVGELLAECEDQEVDDTQNIYEYLPPHCRKLVLLSHLFRIIATRVNIPSLFRSLVDLCIETKAYYHV